MKIQRHMFMSVLLALLLVAVRHGGAQVKGRMTTVDILAALKPGQWVELEGTARPDLSVLCTEIKLLTGDLLDDDWKITGIIRRIDKEKHEIEIGRLPIKVQSQTEFDDDYGKFKSFADMKTNMLIQVEGTYLKDGTFLANEIENDSAKLLEKPERKDRLEVRGRVENIDPTSRTITLMGMSFQLTDRTKGKSAIK
jgi:predicted RNA-binding protein